MYYIMFFLMTFLPVVNIIGVRVPTSLFFIVVILLKNKKIKYDKRMLRGYIFTTILLLMIFCVNIVLNQLQFKDYLYPFMSLMVIINYVILNTLIEKKEISKLIKCLKIFLIVQFIFCVFQMTNLFNFNDIFEKMLFYWQQTNCQQYNNYLEVAYRPFGTIGSPISLSIISYLLAKCIQLYNNDKKYLLLSFILIVLSGARMALLAFIIVETLNIVFFQFKKNPKQSVILMILFLVILILSSNYLPFIKTNVELIFSDETSILDDYSISYRLKMVKMLLDNIKYIFIGGMSINNMPPYVDSEYILRFLQFGIFGFLLLIYPYLYLFKKTFLLKKINKNDVAITIIGFFILSMLTSVVLTNTLYITYISIYFLIVDKKIELEEGQK